MHRFNEVSIEPHGVVRKMPYAMHRHISSAGLLPTTQVFDVALRLSLTGMHMSICTGVIARYTDSDDLCGLRAFCLGKAAGAGKCIPSMANTA